MKQPITGWLEADMWMEFHNLKNKRGEHEAAILRSMVRYGLDHADDLPPPYIKRTKESRKAELERLRAELKQLKESK